MSPLPLAQLPKLAACPAVNSFGVWHARLLLGCTSLYSFRQPAIFRRVSNRFEARAPLMLLGWSVAINCQSCGKETQRTRSDGRRKKCGHQRETTGLTKNIFNCDSRAAFNKKVAREYRNPPATGRTFLVSAVAADSLVDEDLNLNPTVFGSAIGSFV